MTQPELPGTESADPLERRFWKFHEANPEVYEAFVVRARHFVSCGLKTFGAKLVWEQIRIDRQVETLGREKFRLPNEYTAFYARLAMKQEPDLAGLFKLRRRHKAYMGGAFFGE